MEKVIIFGNSDWATFAHLYFRHDSPYEVVAFTVDREFMDGEKFLGLPVIAFDKIEENYSPDDFKMFIPIPYKRMNHLRAERYEQAKLKGFELASYVSTQAITAPGFTCGENCFIFPGNIIDPFTEIGNNVIMGSGNIIGHHSVVKDHCFISSHVAIASKVTVGEYSFIGVNATIRDSVKIGEENIIGAGSIILRDTEDRAVYAPGETPKFQVPSNLMQI